MLTHTHPRLIICFLNKYVYTCCEVYCFLKYELIITLLQLVSLKERLGPRRILTIVTTVFDERGLREMGSPSVYLFTLNYL